MGESLAVQQVGQPPGRRLQERIAQEKNTGEQAEVEVTQVVIGGRKMASRNGKVNAVEEGDCTEDEESALRSQ
jgi:hypothetical protein